MRLTNATDDVTIRSYFEGIYQLSKSEERFPIDLDDVWMMVYERKRQATNYVKYHFKEGEDYVVSQLQTTSEQRKGNHGGAGLNRKIYHLTLSCFEYVVAMKDRKVFEIYSQVFKKTNNAIERGELQRVQQTPMTQAEALLQSVQLLVDMERKQKELEAKTKALEERLNDMERQRKETTEELLSGQLMIEETPQISRRNQIRQLVNQYSNATGVFQQDVWHMIYNDLYYKYGKSIRSYRKLNDRESNLDVAERCGLLEMMYSIISSLCLKIKKQ